jgi:hypothetical protein
VDARILGYGSHQRCSHIVPLSRRLVLWGMAPMCRPAGARISAHLPFHHLGKPRHNRKILLKVKRRKLKLSTMLKQ